MTSPIEQLASRVEAGEAANWPQRSEGFTIHLYCRCYGKPPNYDRQGFAEIFAYTERDARKDMKNSGWKIYRNGTQECPDCRSDK